MTTLQCKTGRQIVVPGRTIMANPPSPNERESLRRAAEKAVANPLASRLSRDHPYEAQMDGLQAQEAYREAANPAAILRLLDERDTQEAAIATLKATDDMRYGQLEASRSMLTTQELRLKGVKAALELAAWRFDYMATLCRKTGDAACLAPSLDEAAIEARAALVEARGEGE